MQQALAIAILVTAAVFLGLTVVIIINKASREARDLRARARRTELEPSVLAHAHGKSDTLAGALGGSPAGFDREVVEDILLDHLMRVRGIEQDRLAKGFEEIGLVDEHLQGLRSSRWWRRAESAERLGLARATVAIEPLTEALSDDVPEVRMRAAKSLGLLGGPRTTRPLILALNEPNRWSTIRIADILTDLGRRVVDELKEVFPELSPAGKLAALDVLARVRPLHAGDWLIERLNDDQSDVRARACHALGSIGDPGFLSPLVGAQKDEAWPVRAMAAKALGRLRNHEAIPSLCESLRDPQWWVRRNSAQALRDMGPRGMEALEFMLADEDRYARHQAVQMLQEAGVVDERVQALGADGADREGAVAFIRKLVAADGCERLWALTEDPEFRSVRESLQALLPSTPGKEATS